MKKRKKIMSMIWIAIGFVLVINPSVASGRDLPLFGAEELMRLTRTWHSQWPALFITVPGHEAEVGGCLAAGRGFVHISAEGDLEPCPFAPFSDTSLRDRTLGEALRSPFLTALRGHPEKLSITEGGCCLWKKREWVCDLLAGVRPDSMTFDAQ